jgi:predicted MFS family arabinose efflux permease
MQRTEETVTRGSRAAPAIALLFAVNALNIYDRMLPAALLEPVRREFALSDARAGLLQTGFIVVYALAGLPLGVLADRWSRRKLLAAGIAAWSALTALGGAASSYWMLLACRLGVGIGEAVCAPAATGWIGALLAPERRARALAVFMFGVPLGGALSYATAAPAAQAWGWRVAMLLAAAPAVPLLAALLLVKEPPRPAAAARTPIPWDRLRQPAFLWIVASGALLNFVLYAFSTFLPALLSRVHGLSLARAGVWIGIGYGVAGVTGGALGGAQGDRVPGRGRLRSAAAAALLASPLAIAGLAAGSPAAALLLLLGAYALLSSYYALVYAAIQDLVPAESIGAAMAVYLMAMYLCGAAFGPWATGGLSDWLAARELASGAGLEAARAAGLRQAMLVIPVLSAVLAGVLFQAGRSRR